MTLRFGRYEAVGKLGEGAMAVVHLARDPVLGRYVAVKVLHRSVAEGKTALQRFFNEAKTVARLPNPHVVEVFDFGKQGRDYFLVMEFVDGRSLRGVLHPPSTGMAAGSAPGTFPEGSEPVPPGPPFSPGAPGVPPGQPLPDEVTASLLCQAAEGLETAARHGVVHRDIKPENLMINSQGYLKIADFGIAHLQDDSLTRTGAVLGSPLYMSPEQVRGTKPITSSSDMFSLGAVFYRCLTGMPPFTSSTLKDLFGKIAREAPIPPRQLRPGVDPDLARLACMLLEKDPARRGDGPRWLRSELRAWLLARGVADPMDRVCRHMGELSRDLSRGLSGQSASEGGRRDGGTVLPRTVVATSPMALEQAGQAFGAAPTMRDSALPMPGEAGEEEGLPSSQTRRRGRVGRQPVRGKTVGRKAAGWKARAGAVLLAAVLSAVLAVAWVAGYFPRVLAGSRTGLEVREEQGTSPGATGKAQDRRQDGDGTGPAEFAGDLVHDAGSGGHADGAADPSATGGEAALRADGQDGGTGRRTPDPAIDMVAPGAVGETGTLVVQSAPPFAKVFLDGNEAGVAPVTLADLSVGSHRLLVKGRSGAPLDTVLRVHPGRRVLRVRLAPETVALESGE